MKSLGGFESITHGEAAGVALVVLVRCLTLTSFHDINELKT